MAYLVTGGAGFIGSRVVRDLAKSGARVVVYDIASHGSALEWLLTGEEKDRVHLIEGDVTDLAHLLRTAKENNIEKIFHLAALLSTGSNANPAMAVRVNCQGTVNVFETARLLQIPKVVWASSMSIFGAADKYPEDCVGNDAPHYPWGVYGACKDFAENLASHYVANNKLDITAVRYNLVYGVQPGQGTTGNILRELLVNPALGKPGRVPFGDLVRGWQYVDDAARATIMAGSVVRPRTLAFSTAGDVHSIREVAAYVKEIIPDASLTLLPGELGLAWKFDTGPIEKEIGYRPQWSMEQGVKEIINTVRAKNGLPPV